MGIDFLDIIFRLEKRFQIEIGRPGDSLWYEIANGRNPPDITAGELYEVVVRKIEEQGREIPANSWVMFCEDLAFALGVDEGDIYSDSLLIHELGMS